MHAENNIILAAGSLNPATAPVAAGSSNAMIPVNGKPVIGWILDDLLRKGIREATVVLRREDERLQNFLRWAYSRRMEVCQVPLSRSRSILHSLWAGWEARPTSGLVRIILGDTLIRDPFQGQEDFVYLGLVEDTHRWCLAVVDGEGGLVDYVDKQELPPGKHQALAGYYHLCRGEEVATCLKAALEAGETQISNLLRRYGRSHRIRARMARDWFDFGNIDHLVEARRRLLQPRFFNSLHIHPVLNTITKVSRHHEKLRQELEWYRQLPEPLRALTPRILSHREENGSMEVVQEYYGYPTLAELFVYGDLHPDTWFSILRRVIRVHQEFRRHRVAANPADVLHMYREKTRQRLHQLRGEGKSWEELLSREHVAFNGRELLNWPALEEFVDEQARSLAETASFCVLHGDFCFSNILFDLTHQIVRLIDPRGSFGRPGIYGDGRYDMAKLRHSVCGLYDYIVADLFQLAGAEGEFRGSVFVNGAPRRVGLFLDQMLVEIGYDLREIRFIEGLLFLSMPPLHRGHPQRQLFMYLTGLSRLNEVYHAHRRGSGWDHLSHQEAAPVLR